MNRLLRIRLRPRSAWRTPWQSDTLAGLLCWALARSEGPEVLRDRLIEPMLAGEPPFVLSDAFPGDLFPVPVALRLLSWPSEHRRTVKLARWISASAFDCARRGERIPITDFVVDSPLREQGRTRNTLARSTDTTGEAGSLFTLSEYHIDPRHPTLAGKDWLSVYVRVRPSYDDLLLTLFSEVATIGFGADISAGLGAFDFPGGTPNLELVDALSEIPNPTGVVVLSTFQPGPSDPSEGGWESFTKFGKLGPDFGLTDVRKNPVILLRPGACFQCDTNRLFVGRAISMHELVPAATAGTLAGRGTSVIHPAFGLTVPAAFGTT